jgi:hypothetical protein
MLVLTYDVPHLSCGHHEEEEDAVEGFPPVGHGKGIHLILKMYIYTTYTVVLEWATVMLPFLRRKKPGMKIDIQG